MSRILLRVAAHGQPSSPSGIENLRIVPSEQNGGLGRFVDDDAFCVDPPVVRALAVCFLDRIVSRAKLKHTGIRAKKRASVPFIGSVACTYEGSIARARKAHFHD